MKTLRDYMVETEQWLVTPAAGDDFAIELEDGTLVETYIMAVEGNAVLLDTTPEIYAVLGQWAELHEEDDAPDSELTILSEGRMKELMWQDAERMTLEQFVDKYGDEEWIREFWNNIMGDIDEAKYQGREVALNKPTAGDVKKFKVYVKDPATGNIKKVNFGHGGKTAKRLGQKTMRIRKSNPAARKSFRARHNCANPGPKTKARYWSCRKW